MYTLYRDWSIAQIFVSSSKTGCKRGQDGARGGQEGAGATTECEFQAIFQEHADKRATGTTEIHRDLIRAGHPGSCIFAFTFPHLL